MKPKKVLSICKTNGLYYLYDRIDRSGEITQWLGDGYALYPLDGLPILDEESFCAVFDITGKQREKILFRHERLPEHLNVEDVAAGDKLVREHETTFINGGLRLKPLKTNNGVTFIRSLYLSPLEDVIDMVQFYERTTPQGGSYIVAKAGFLTAAVIMPYVISKKFADELEELKEQIEDTRDDLNPRLRLAGCLITCFIRADAEKQGEAWLRSRPEYPVFDTRIRYSDKVTESTFSEIPIVEYSRRSGTAMDYIAFVREYLRRGKK